MSRILSSDQRGSGIALYCWYWDFVISWIQCCCTHWPYLQYQWIPSCLIEQTLPFHWILLEPLSKQSNMPISTFKLIFHPLDCLLLKPNALQVIQGQHHLWSSHPGKRSTKPTMYLVIWLQTLRDLLCICWSSNFPPMKQTTSCKQTVLCLSMGHTPMEIQHVVS